MRRQLEDYIKAELGEEYLEKAKAKTELLNIKKEMVEIKKRLGELEARKAELEKIMNK